MLQIVTEVLCLLNYSSLKQIYNCYFTVFGYSLISKFTALPFLNLLTYKQTVLFRFIGIFVFFLKNSTFLAVMIGKIFFLLH